MVNDRPLLNFNRGSNINTEIPFNTFLNNGINEIWCKIIPPRGQDILSDTAFVRITILESGLNNSEPSRELNKFNTPSFKADQDSGPYAQYILETRFTVSILYNSVLSAGLDFISSGTLQIELFQAYMEFREAFQTKNIDKVMRLLTLKINETAALKGTSPAEMENEIRADYLGYISDPSLELWEFTEDKVFLKIYARGKLACLEVKNGNQPLCFINRTDHIAIYIPLYFFRDSVSAQLKVIR
jgi:hypothetical protein